MNSKINNIKLEDAQGQAKELLTGVKSAIGMVPNLFGVIAQSPSILKGHLEFGNGLSAGVLTAKQREQIALVVSQENNCGYCVSAHSAIGKGAGLSPEAIRLARAGQAEDTATQGILELAKTLVNTKGQVGSSELEAARSAGLSDAQIVEVVANVSATIFTNYINNLAGTVIDFPVVDLAS